MEKFVIKNSILIVLILGSCDIFCQKGSTLPFTFPPSKERANIKGRPEYINSVLMSGISSSEGDECKSTWDIFFFRVTGKNEVDSIRHNGNLSSEITNQIISNIKSTQGHWKIPLGTNKKDYCWFVYPYFRISSSTPNCKQSENVLLKENVWRMAQTMNEFYRFFQGYKHVVILNPEYGLSSE